MFRQKRPFSVLVSLLCFAFIFSSEAEASTGKDGNNQKTEAYVYASGTPVGIYVKTKGLLVLGTQEIKTVQGTCSPSRHRLRSGDYILAVNGTKINSKKQFQQLLQRNEDKELIVTFLRKNAVQKVKMKPVYSEEEQCWRIGAWIRNDTQGIGTVTFVCSDGSFAALGHGINDLDLGVRMDIAGGNLYETAIASIKVGKAKDPGELIGSIDYATEHYLGTIIGNTNCGIYGQITDQKELFMKEDPIPIAQPEEIHDGTAYLKTSISGKSRNYTIEIEKTGQEGKDVMKSLKIHVTDSELLSMTGGIVQGLSGSPIIQDGKLIGAVTHVMVNDPSWGYGIYAKDMYESMKE